MGIDYNTGRNLKTLTLSLRSLRATILNGFHYLEEIVLPKLRDRFRWAADTVQNFITLTYTYRKSSITLNLIDFHGCSLSVVL